MVADEAGNLDQRREGRARFGTMTGTFGQLEAAVGEIVDLAREMRQAAESNGHRTTDGTGGSLARRRENVPMISCCGMICDKCDKYPMHCLGCQVIRGDVYWLKYVEDAICPIYNCCNYEKNFVHCGQCEHFPCEKYDRGNPIPTAAENAENIKRQIGVLRSK